MQHVNLPLSEVSTPKVGGDIVDTGRRGKRFEAMFIQALDVLGLAYEESVGFSAAGWDVRPVGEGWHNLIRDRNTNIKVHSTRWLFSGKAVYQAAAAAAAGVKQGTLTPDQATQRVEKAVRATLNAKGLPRISFFKPKDKQVQQGIVRAAQRKDAEALRKLMVAKNFSTKRLGRNYTVTVNIDWNARSCEPNCSASRRKGSWQQTATIHIDGGVGGQEFGIGGRVEFPKSDPTFFFRDRSGVPAKPPHHARAKGSIARSSTKGAMAEGELVEAASEPNFDSESLEESVLAESAEARDVRMLLEAQGFSEQSVAIMFSVPPNTAKQFPQKGEHDPTVPHVSILIVGDVGDDEWRTVQQVVREVASEMRPFGVRFGKYGEFKVKAKGAATIGWVGIESPKLWELHSTLWKKLKDAGVKPAHRYGDHGNPENPNKRWYHAHATLAYMGPDETFTGRIPQGSWTVNKFEVWRGSRTKVPMKLGAPAPAVMTEARTCPMPGYGGLRGAMRFKPYTGYSVGFSRIAEAVHCILGSVVRAQEVGEVAEKHHVREELGIINRYMRDGAGRGSGVFADATSPLRLIGKAAGATRQEPYDDEDARGSVEDIRKNGPLLQRRAEKYLRELPGWGLLPQNERIARAAYKVARALGAASVDSVQRWPQGIGNAYRDPHLVKAVKNLNAAVEATVGLGEARLDEVKVSARVVDSIRAARRNGIDLQIGLDPRGNLVLGNDIYKAWPDFNKRMLHSGVVNLRSVHGLVDGLTRGNPAYDPALYKVLQALVRIAPETAAYEYHGGRKLTGSVRTVGQWVKGGLKQVMPKVPTMFHGTASVFADSVASKGIRPRGEGGLTSHDAGGSQPSRPDMVYLATTFGVAEQAALAARGKHGGVPVLYKVEVPDPAKLRQDEDAEPFFGEEWWRGLRSFGTVAYQGRIPARFVKPHLIWNRDARSWERWDGRVPALAERKRKAPYWTPERLKAFVWHGIRGKHGRKLSKKARLDMIERARVYARDVRPAPVADDILQSLDRLEWDIRRGRKPPKRPKPQPEETGVLAGLRSFFAGLLGEDNLDESLFEATRTIPTRMARKPGDTGRTKVRYDWEDEPPLKSTDRLMVYHGFRSYEDAILACKYGLSGRDRAMRVYSYENDNNPRGLFVTIDHPTAKKFTGAHKLAVIIEFAALVRDLERPVWPGGGYTAQGERSMSWREIDPDDPAGARTQVQRAQRGLARERSPGMPFVAQSDKPEVAEKLMAGEFQTLFVGDLNPKAIKAVWVQEADEKGYLYSNKPYKRMSRVEFLKQFGHTKLTRQHLDNLTGGKAVERAQMSDFKPQDNWSLEVFAQGLSKRHPRMFKTMDDLTGYVRAWASRGEDYLIHRASSMVWPKQLPGLIAWAKSLNETAAPVPGMGLSPGAPIKTGGWVALRQVEVPIEEIVEAGHETEVDEGIIPAAIQRMLRKREERLRDLPKLMQRIDGAKAVHLRSARWPWEFMIFKSSRPDCQPLQLSYLKREGGDVVPTGHDCVKDMAKTVEKLWREYGRLTIVAMHEHVEAERLVAALNEERPMRSGAVAVSMLPWTPEQGRALAAAWDAWRDKPSWEKRGQSAWYADPEVKRILGLGPNDRIPQRIKRAKRRDLIEGVTGPYYHGTSTALGIKRELLPAATSGKQTEPRVQRRHRVFMTTNVESAQTYARRAVREWGGEPVVYLVEPTSPVKVLSRRGPPLGPVVHAAGARVVRTVDEAYSSEPTLPGPRVKKDEPKRAKAITDRERKLLNDAKPWGEVVEQERRKAPDPRKRAKKLSAIQQRAKEREDAERAKHAERLKNIQTKAAEKQRAVLVGEASAPACAMPSYGGLPEAGGFGSNTSLEVGVQRIAEATHCLLGSIERAPRMTWRIERGHITEELGIIVSTQDEWSHRSHIEALSSSRYAGATPKTIRAFETVAPKLRDKASRFLAQHKRWYPGDKLATECIGNCYRLIVKLMDELIRFAREWQGGRRDMVNPLALVGAETRLLKASVGRLLQRGAPTAQEIARWDAEAAQRDRQRAKDREVYMDRLHKLYGYPDDLIPKTGDITQDLLATLDTGAQRRAEQEWWAMVNRRERERNESAGTCEIIEIPVESLR